MRHHWHLRRLLPLVLLGSILGPVSVAAADDLNPLSSAELHRACAAYVQISGATEGGTCATYIRGFVEGSKDVVVQAPSGSQRSAFMERALRTRLGRPKDARPTYCIDGATSMGQFVNQLLQEATSTPPRDDADASELLVATLQRYHTCAK